MPQPIDWTALAQPLDVSDVPRSEQHLRGWMGYAVDARGVMFQCATAAGDRAELRLDVVAADVIRVRMGRPGRIAAREARPSDLLVGPPGAARFEQADDGEKLTLLTGRLRIEVDRCPWQLRVAGREPGALPFFRQRIDDRSYGPGYEVAPVGFERGADGRPGVRETVALGPGEAFYGLGEKFTAFDLRGREVAAWAVDSGNVTSIRSYKNVPFFMSSAGYGVFLHTTAPVVYRMGSASGMSYSFHVAEEALDYFLMYGPAYRDILAAYGALTGRPALPPKWSFGFWQSRAGYRSRAEVEAVAAELRARDFPCDVISLDPWWMGAPPWSTYAWDEARFPRPADMIAGLREQGFRTCLWIHPYVPAGTPLYEEGAAAGYFVNKPDPADPTRRGPEISPVVEAFSGAALAAIDFTNPDAVRWFQGRLARLLDDGVAVFKSDFGEQAPADAVTCDGRDGLEMHNVYPLLYNKAVYELTEQRFGRGLTWGRSGYAGSQRYPVQWGGDSYASLDQMAGQLRGLLSYGMSGVPFCSHDVGGFDYTPAHFDEQPDLALWDTYGGDADGPQDPVVYVRWLQFGVFSSHLRAHGKPPREPWQFGAEAEAICRRYLKLRYRLLPYIYTQAVKSAETGLPMVRPLALTHGDDPTTRGLDQEYLFGDDFLVAPVFREDGRAEVYLPAGEWIDFWTKERVAGPRWLQVTAALDTLPLWVRAGAMIPFGPEMRYVNEKPLDPLTVELYAPGEGGRLVIRDEDAPDVEVSYWRDERGALRVAAHGAAGEVRWAAYGE